MPTPQTYWLDLIAATGNHVANWRIMPSETAKFADKELIKKCKMLENTYGSKKL